MTNGLAVENTEWTLWVTLGGILLWLIFIWKEKYNYPGLKFLVNSIVSLIAIFALALLILKPLKFASPKSFQLAVLTDGFKQQQLDSLKKEYENLVSYTYTPEHNLLKDTAIPETVFILGNGINAYDLWQLDSLKTHYLKGNTPKGIITINYNNRNTIGNLALFKGRYVNPTKGHKLILETPDKKTIDSIVFKDSKDTNFKLEAYLKAQGNFIYHLTEKDSLGTIISSDPLPISISGENLLKITVINDFPTFETKYLKNYLAEQGHAVAIRSQITKNRYKYEYFNTNAQLNTELSKKSLALTDLLIIDATTLNKLSRTRKNAIRDAVNNYGLGVYIQADLSFFGSKNNLASFKFNRHTFTTAQLGSKLKSVNVFPYDFKNGFSIQPIHNYNGKILTAYRQLGLGKIGASAIKNSYELLLNGHKNSYQTLWSNIIETLSKKTITGTNLNTKSHIAFKNEPFNFEVATQAKDPSITHNNSINLALKQDLDIPTLWKGITYPNKQGWQTLQMAQDSMSTFQYYVADSTKWQALKAYKTIKDNTHNFSDQDLKDMRTTSVEIIDLKWLFMLFILALGYVWLQPKL